MEIIRKYQSSNRKYWSTKEHKYITLQDIIDRIVNKKQFKVLGGNGKNTKDNDITTKTVKSAFYHRVDMSLKDYKWLIRHLHKEQKRGEV